MNQARSILIYSPQFDRIGGIEVHLVELCVHLVEHGWKVCLWTTSNSLDSRLVERLVRAEVEMVSMPCPRGAASRMAKAWWLWRKACRLRRRRWDVVYTNGIGALVPIAWWAGGTHARRIHHHHTSADLAEQKFWGWTYHQILRIVPELVVVSKRTGRSIQEAVGRQQRTQLTCLFPVGEVGKIPPVGLAGPPWRFVFAGRLCSGKGIDTICKLSKSPCLQDVEWHIWGEGAEYPPPFFEAFSKVHYHGSYSGLEGLQEVHRQTHAMVLFSTNSEGLPIMLMEASAAGLPWIASRRGGTEELALRTEDCLLIAENFTYDEALAACVKLRENLERELTNPDALRRRFLDRFGPEMTRAEWRDYLDPPCAETKRSVVSS